MEAHEKIFFEMADFCRTKSLFEIKGPSSYRFHFSIKIPGNYNKPYHNFQAA
jgi:hypothetical protein